MLACPPGEQLLEHIDSGVPVFPLLVPEGFRSFSRWGAGWTGLAGSAGECAAAVRRLRQIVTQNQVQLIHANNLKMLLLAAAAAPEIPRIWHVRDIFPATSLNKQITNLACRLSSRILCVSRAVAQQFATTLKVELLYNAVELPAIDGASRCANAKITFGYAGRLDRGKGLETLIEAFCSLKAETTRLKIVGDGPLASTFNGLESVEQVSFQKQMSTVWPEFDVVVQPSDEPDSFPRSVIEAMSFGKPVIGSRIGGIPEAIEDGVTGFTFQPGDAGALANRIRMLLTDGELRRSMGRAGRKRCELLFTVERQMALLAAHYRKLAPAVGRAA